MEAMNKNIGIQDVQLKCKVKPLNFLKQVIGILLCADQATGRLRDILNAEELMLNKENNTIPEEVYISMVCTVQPTYGFKGFMPTLDNINGLKDNIEFVFKPFGFKLTLLDSEKGLPELNLANWKNYKYDEEIQTDFDLSLKKFNR